MTKLYYKGKPVLETTPNGIRIHSSAKWHEKLRALAVYFWFTFGRWILWSLIGFFMFMLIAPDVQAEAKYELDYITVFETGEPMQFKWCNPSDQRTDDWHHTIEVYEFPPKEAALPVVSIGVIGHVSTYDYTPERAGLYYARAKSCSFAEGCSRWAISYQPYGDDTCLPNPQRLLWYFKLGSPSGGGIDG